MLSLLKHPLLY